MALPKLLIFDLDGTLIDSSLDLCNSVNAALSHVQRQELSNEVIASYIGDGAETLVRRALGGDEESSDSAQTKALFRRTFEYFLTYYREHKLDTTRCYDGVIEALTMIRVQHPQLPMAVLTNKPVNPSRQICRALGLEPFFFQNYGGNSFGTKKPEPEGMLALISEASSLLAGALSSAVIRPDEVVLIGDSDVDVMTARRCGSRVLGCEFGLAPEALLAAKPDAVVGHPREWMAALGL